MAEITFLFTFEDTAIGGVPYPENKFLLKNIKLAHYHNLWNRMEFEIGGIARTDVSGKHWGHRWK